MASASCLTAADLVVGDLEPLGLGDRLEHQPALDDELGPRPHLLLDLLLGLLEHAEVRLHRQAALAELCSSSW